MTGPLYRLSRFTVRRAKWVLAAWVVAAAAIVLFANSIGRNTNDDLSIPGSDSTHATNTLDRYLPKQANGSNPIVLVDPGGKRLDRGANETAIKQTMKALKANRYVQDVVSPLSQAGADDLSKDGKTAYIAVNLTLGPDELEEDQAQEIIDTATAVAHHKYGLRVSAGGYLGQAVSKPATESSEAIGVAVAIVVLLFAFGTAVAMTLPIVTALFGLGTGLALIGIFGHVISVPSIAPTLGTMLGLGVGIDYALFIITRHLRYLRGGMEAKESAARATATAGGAVVFAGSTVVVALLALYFGGIPIVRSLGYSAAIVVAVAIVAALTLLPALLGLLGDRILRGHVSFAKGAHAEGHPVGWNRWAHFVGRHPWPAAIAGVAILAVLALPVLDIYLGQPDNGQIPKDTQTRQSYDAITKGFSAGTNGPMLIAVKFSDPAKPDTKKLHQVQQQQKQQQAKAQQKYQQQAQQAALAGEPPPPEPQGPSPKQQRKLDQQEAFLKSSASDPRLVKLQNRISKPGDVYNVSPAKVSKNGDAAVFSGRSVTSSRLGADPRPRREAARRGDSGGRGRRDWRPTWTARRQPSWISPTRSPEAGAGDRDRRRARLPAADAGVPLDHHPAARGAHEPARVAAAYGVLAAVFELGWGLSLIGLDHPMPIVSFVPLLMFAILFGLSMDYQVFLLTRMQEHWRLEGDNHDAVVGGLAGTSRVIISAALIMFAVFASFILNGDPTVKQFGVGLAVAVAIDATVVRTLLVPAVMIIVGRANWWLPGWLERQMPNIGIEGDEYFEVLDNEDEARANEEREPAAADSGKSDSGGD